MSDDQVGRVLGSEHTSTATFRVVVDDDQFLQLDDLVVVRTEVPKMGEVRTYGVVTEAEAIYEGARYESDTHRIAELGIMPAQKVRSATVAVTRVDPEVWVSADPGEPVERATGDERSRAGESPPSNCHDTHQHERRTGQHPGDHQRERWRR